MNDLDDNVYKFTCEKHSFYTSAQTQFDAETSWDFVMSCEFKTTKYKVIEVDIASVPEDANWF